MKLLFDLGNTLAKAVVWGAGQKQAQSTVPYTGDWPEQLLAALKLESGAYLGTPIKAAYVASVASKQSNEQLKQALQQQGIATEFAQTRAEQADVRCAYAKPERLGVDRWLAVLAAFHTARSLGHSGAAMVIDCGTAITVDAVQANGQHLGGLIAPGVARMVASLSGATPGIPAQELAWDKPALDLADNTATAVFHGALQAAVGLIDNSRIRGQQNLPEDSVFFLTGGAASALQPLLAEPWTLRSGMVFDGLRYYFAV